jgi:hypothetical protein
MWTVEWIDLDGQTTVQNSCLESNTLAELYRALQVEKTNAAKRKAEAEASNSGTRTPNGKRQRGLGNGDDRKLSGVVEENAPSGTLADQPTSSSTGGNDAEASTADEARPNPSNHDAELVQATEIHHIEVEPPSNLSADISETSTSNNTTQPLPPSTLASPITTDAAPISSFPEKPSHHYYLFKPSTTGPAKVLIPMDASKTLTQALSTHAVLEFPTFYILPHGSDDVASAATTSQQAFITEETYLADRRACEARNPAQTPFDHLDRESHATSDRNPAGGSRPGVHHSATGANATATMTAEQRASMKTSANHGGGSAPLPPDRDPQKILEMLRRDLSGMM